MLKVAAKALLVFMLLICLLEMWNFKSKDRLLPIQKPLVMGILNATPDSFYAESRIHADKAVDTAGKMLQQGAGILDIGGQSTRPGAALISEMEEEDRVLPIIQAVRKAFPESWISIDTFYASVANKAIAEGADMVNDISAGEVNTNMLEIVATAQVPFIAMHKKGMPENMQQNPEYPNVTHAVLDYFVQKKVTLENAGVFDWIVDPGFGFGKTARHNFELLNHLSTFCIFNKPIMVGISRKGMVYKTLGITADNALNGTTALHMAALIKGANILRVHDVKEAVQCVQLYCAFPPQEQIAICPQP